MMRKKILFVCKAESVHSARWISQLDQSVFDIYVYSVLPSVQAHPILTGYTVFIPLKCITQILKRIKLGRYLPIIQYVYSNIRTKLNSNYHAERLAVIIRKIRPDLIHSLETQSSGYLVSSVKKNYFNGKQFPLWWHTNWGSDIYIFGRLQRHKQLIRDVMENCEYYSCECERDVALARSFGFNGKTLPVYPNTGGFDLDQINGILAQSKRSSERKTIMLKGYQGWAGRALTGLRALERCADLLRGYNIIIYSNPYGEDIAIAAELFTASTGVSVHILPAEVQHAVILKYHSEARISIGLSIGDAISTSLLEAMAMGSFPIQSCTSCTSEWFEDGVTGLVVPPEDPEIIEIAIRKALLDDSLVNVAAEKNYQTIQKRVEYKKLKSISMHSYLQILSSIM